MVFSQRNQSSDAAAMTHFRMAPVIPTLIALVMALGISGTAFSQAPGKDVYQDFRNNRSPGSTFRLGGFDPDNEIKPEKEGLRIKLPAERGQHLLAEVNADFPLTGDFEFTATYEILSAQPPLKGYGVGVNLTISTVADPKKFGKLCRVMRPKEGNVYLAETWPKYQQRVKKSAVLAGQLRLARIGAALHFLVSDGAGHDFEEIWTVRDYGVDDIGYAGFQVSDSGEPGNPTDARLIDLRVRLGKIDLDKLASAAPLAAPAPPPSEPAPAPAVELPRWLIALAVCIGSIFFVVVLALVILFLMRSRKVHKPEA
jgi:hypothetical protein